MTLKEKVINRSYMTGTHVHLLDASVTEMLSYLGYDFIWLDMEHTQLSCEDAITILWQQKQVERRLLCVCLQMTLRLQKRFWR